MRTNVGSKEKMEFAYLMAKHSNATLSQIERLLRYGRTLGNLAEAHCNGDCPYNPHDYDGTGNDCPKQIRIRTKVFELCKEIGVKAYYQSDPRGATLKIQVPDGYTNDMGRDGICVPTS